MDTEPVHYQIEIIALGSRTDIVGEVGIVAEDFLGRPEQRVALDLECDGGWNNARERRVTALDVAAGPIELRWHVQWNVRWESKSDLDLDLDVTEA